MATIRSRHDLKYSVQEHLPCPDRFPEWYIETRSDISNQTMRDLIESESWVTIEGVVDVIIAAQTDTVTLITECVPPPTPPPGPPAPSPPGAPVPSGGEFVDDGSGGGFLP